MDKVTLALAKKYVKKSLLGGGAVVGKNVIISSVSPIEGGNRITFSYTLDDGTVKSSTLDVMNGKDGEKGDKGDSIRGADGVTPQFTIGTVTTIPSDEEASASITGTSANPILNLNIPRGEAGSDINSSDEKVKLTSSSAKANYLEDLIDNTTIEIDTANNWLVVKKVDGQIATIAEINFLHGVTSNIQTQINNLGKSMTMYGVFDTKADLITSNTPMPVDGNTAIVITDEDNDGKQMTYIYIAATSTWTQVAESAVLIRDFTVNPIDLSTETTGVLPKEKIDTAIARLTNVLDKATYKGSADGVVKQADSITGMTAAIAQLNEAITNSHNHINKNVLDKIIANGIGNRILADNGSYKEILVLSSTAPTDTYTLWVDNSDSTKPILKIYDGKAWIAVSGVKVDGTTVIINENGAISVNDDTSFHIRTNAGAHNSVYRGKNLGTSVTDTQYAAIAAGTFEDLYIGDYWTIGGINYRIAAFDYYLGCGDTKLPTHHIVVVPDSSLYDARMNASNTTKGGYVGSEMYTVNLKQAKTIIKSAFNGHVLKHRVFLVNAVANGRPYGCVWCDSEVDLMNEQMVYGGAVLMPMGDGNTISTSTSVGIVNARVDKSQLPLFAYRPDLISNRISFWLRDVVSDSQFANVGAVGRAYCYSGGNPLGVRPAFCVY